MKKVFLLFILWFVIANLFALLVNNRLNLKPDTAYPWIQPQFEFQQQGSSIINIHNRWDAYWYLDIAKNGYSFLGPNQLSNIVFFPMYPLFIQALHAVTLADFPLAGWIVSTVFAFLSCVYLYKIVKEFHPDADPIMAVFLLLIFPTAFFLNVIYSESTFFYFL